MTSSIDPTNEATLIQARLNAIGDAVTYNGIPQGLDLPRDAWGNKAPYRDFEAGGSIPSGQGRLLAAGEQAQPYMWAFQVHHYATNRADLLELCTATDRALIGWNPSPESGQVGTFFFTMYDEFDVQGERVGYIATRFFDLPLGQSPDMTL